MDSNFFQYNKSNIISNPNEKIIYNSNDTKCINECNNDNNCQGLIISNPICDKNIPLTECIQSLTDIDVLNIQPNDLYNFKCKFINNINDLSKIYKSDKNKCYIKNQYVDMLNSDNDMSKAYYLKINNKYLSINEELNNLFLISSDDVEKACLFKFNSNNNIVETKTQKCLQTNGKYLILSDCDNLINNQKFVYENKLNSIRPLNNSNGNSILCLTLIDKNNDPDINTNNNKITLEECNFIDSQNIQIEKIKENFSTLKNLEKKIENINYCSNPIYKSVVFIILVCILIYFIWFIIRKKYYDEDSDYDKITTTPFNV